MASLRKRIFPSGKVRWQVDYRDGRHRQFTTKRAADSLLLKARAEVLAGVHIPESVSINECEAADLWFSRRERDGLEHRDRAELRDYPLTVSGRTAGGEVAA
jgi:integrase